MKERRLNENSHYMAKIKIYFLNTKYAVDKFFDGGTEKCIKL